MVKAVSVAVAMHGMELATTILSPVAVVAAAAASAAQPATSVPVVPAAVPAVAEPVVRRIIGPTLEVEFMM